MKMKTQNTRTYGTQKKAVLRGKFIAMKAYIKRSERSQINDLMLHLKLLEKQEQAKPKISRREIIKIRAKTNEKKKRTIQRINETISLFFEKINKIDQLMANLSKMRKEKTKLTKSEMKKGRKQQTPWKSRESLETTLRTYIPINCKILKKWTNF
jgi:hypothetical protein